MESAVGGRGRLDHGPRLRVRKLSRLPWDGILRAKAPSMASMGLSAVMRTMLESPALLLSVCLNSPLHLASLRKGNFPNLSTVIDEFSG